MKVKVSVYKADDGSYWCHTEKDVYGTGLNGQGNSVAEAKQDLYACLEEAKEDYVCQGKTANPVEFEYVYDLQSFFEYFSVFNVTEVARRAGINPTLMRQYTSGVKKAGEKTYAKLSACINDIRRDIISASFWQFWRFSSIKRGIPFAVMRRGFLFVIIHSRPWSQNQKYPIWW